MASTSLSDLHSDLRLLCESVEAFQPRSLLYRPPIIDANEEYGEQDLPGFKKFKGTVENELRWVDQVSMTWKSPEMTKEGPLIRFHGSSSLQNDHQRAFPAPTLLFLWQCGRKY